MLQREPEIKVSQRKIWFHFDGLAQLRDGGIVLAGIVIERAHFGVDDERKRIQFQRAPYFALGFLMAGEYHQTQRIPMMSAGIIGI